MIHGHRDTLDSSSFEEWSLQTRREGRLPRIVVVGSVGKSIVARLIDEVAQSVGLRTALLTDGAVEILGRRRGEWPRDWEHALRRLAGGTLDLAVEELSWSDLPALSTTGATIGALVISTICPDRDVCRLDSTRDAISALRSLLAVMPAEVVAVVNLDDSAIPLLGEMGNRPLAVSAIRPEQPALKRLYDESGLGAWLDDDALVIARGRTRIHLGAVATFPLTLDGSSRFQVHNLMAASLACAAIGVPAEVISRVLRSFNPSPTQLPHSLGLIRTATSRVILDRPSGSGFLGPLMKTLRSLKPTRLTCVTDYSPSHPVDDLVEVGRILARQAHAFVLIDEDVGLAGVMGLRAGIAQTPHPPPIIHVATLPRAIRRALATAGHDDLTLVLSHRPQLVHRILARDRIADVA